MVVGEYLKEVRVSKKMKQYDVASMLGITPTYLSLVEKGKVSPSNDLIERFSDLFSIPVPVIYIKSMELSDFKKGTKKKVFDQVFSEVNFLIERLTSQ